MADKSQKVAPNGYVPLEALCVELAAGGIEQDNIEHVSMERYSNRFDMRQISMSYDISNKDYLILGKIELINFDLTIYENLKLLGYTMSVFWRSLDLLINDVSDKK
jgi:hypothetical protein